MDQVLADGLVLGNDMVVRCKAEVWVVVLRILKRLLDKAFIYMSRRRKDVGVGGKE